MPKHERLDKKRETIRRQLYGKEVMITPSKPVPSSAQKANKSAYTFTTSASSTSSAQYTNTYLLRDFVKIIIFSVIAVALQFVLFYALNTHLINLKFLSY